MCFNLDCLASLRLFLKYLGLIGICSSWFCIFKINVFRQTCTDVLEGENSLFLLFLLDSGVSWLVLEHLTPALALNHSLKPLE